MSDNQPVSVKKISVPHWEDLKHEFSHRTHRDEPTENDDTNED